ncbi:MAG: hypothetical protein FD174_15 [Geobacteraceae bacterium]|nr:MAG: hypothetical protein FD174_15 [Geobacteraceae bacterium]
MRKSTVKSGLNLVSAGIVLVTLATFFHEQIAWILSLSHGSETRFVFLGLFWGGMAGCLGIVVTVAGFLRGTVNRQEITLVPAVIILVAVALLFIFLLFSSFTNSEQPRLRPGETITI